MTAVRPDSAHPLACAIMQPTYLPWIGYFDLISRVDIFIFLDDAQLVRRSWQVRNRIRTSQDCERMLSIPVCKSAHRDDLRICDALPQDAENWRHRHLRTLEQSYARAPHRHRAIDIWKRHYLAAPAALADMHMGFIREVSGVLGFRPSFRRASELDVSGSRDIRLLGICQSVGASLYLSPPGSAGYISAEQPEGAFTDSGIALRYQSFHHPHYAQGDGEFLPFMGIIDLLAHHAPDEAARIILSGRRPALTPDQLDGPHP